MSRALGVFALVLSAAACGRSEAASPAPAAAPPDRCFTMPAPSADLVVDSAAVADTLARLVGAAHPDAELELEVTADTMVTTVRMRRTTLPESLVAEVERAVDWNALPAMRRGPPEAPELAILASRDTAAPPVHVLHVTLSGGAVTRMALGPGEVCQPRLINGAQILYAMRESGVVELDESARAIVRVYIDPEGLVFHTEIVHASGNAGFDALARGLAMSALFEPASMRGRPIPTMTELPFELRAGRRR